VRSFSLAADATCASSFSLTADATCASGFSLTADATCASGFPLTAVATCASGSFRAADAACTSGSILAANAGYASGSSLFTAIGSFLAANAGYASGSSLFTTVAARVRVFSSAAGTAHTCVFPTVMASARDLLSAIYAVAECARQVVHQLCHNTRSFCVYQPTAAVGAPVYHADCLVDRDPHAYPWPPGARVCALRRAARALLPPHVWLSSPCDSCLPAS